jgi:hypothetical protein
VGHSRTYNVIGQSGAELLENGNQRVVEYPAMTKTDIEQMRIRARKDGKVILYWYSQTKTGEKMLGNTPSISDEALGHVTNLEPCKVCLGPGCPVCNYSGFCKPWNEKHWQDWQIDNMKHEYRQERQTERKGT